jgi:multidrug efflux pump subunit AcrA (membrane-fusion protein)
MKLSDDDLREIWRGPSQGDPSDCLTDTAWARLLSTEADDEERLRAAGHIASCSACADQYRLLQPLQSWGADVERELSPRDAPADRWNALRAWWSSPRLALAMAAAIVLLLTQGVVLSRFVASQRQNAQLETQLAARASALTASETSLAALREELRSETANRSELKTLQERLAQLSTPQLGAVVDLEPQYAGTVRGAPDPQTVTTDPNAPSVTLVLGFPPLASRSTLEVEVTAEGGQILWVGRVQRGQDTETLTLTLPGSYRAGDYVIRLFDVTRGRTPLATYPVVIRQTEGSNR